MKKNAAARKIKRLARENARCPLCGHRWHDCRCAAEVLGEYAEHAMASTEATDAKRRQRTAKFARLATRRACDRAKRDQILAAQAMPTVAKVVDFDERYDVRISGIMLDEEDLGEEDAAMAHA